MVTITKYAIKSGKTFYRVRYEKPDGRQSDKRGFKRKADAEKWAAEASEYNEFLMCDALDVTVMVLHDFARWCI